MQGVLTLDAPDLDLRLRIVEVCLAGAAAAATFWAVARGTVSGGIRWVRSFAAMPAAVEHLRKSAVVSDARHRAIIEGANLAYWESSVDGNCQYASRGLAELMGCGVDEILRMGWVQRIHPDDQERIARLYTQATNSGSSFHAEYRLVRNDGQTIWVLGEATPGVGPGGEVGIFIGSAKRIERE